MSAGVATVIGTSHIYSKKAAGRRVIRPRKQALGHNWRKLNICLQDLLQTPSSMSPIMDNAQNDGKKILGGHQSEGATEDRGEASRNGAWSTPTSNQPLPTE